jgi:hypothetical protein
MSGISVREDAADIFQLQVETYSTLLRRRSPVPDISDAKVVTSYEKMPSFPGAREAAVPDSFLRTRAAATMGG